MRRFINEDQIRLKGVEKTTNCMNNLPGFQAISELASVGTINPIPNKREFYVATPFHYALERSPLCISLSCKEVQDLTIPDLELIGINNNMHYTSKPIVGGQRGDPKTSLGYDSIYPTNTPLLKKRDTFFAFLNSPLN